MRSHPAPACVLGFIVMCAAVTTLGACSQRVDDLAAFQERRTQCDHFRGEEPYDAARAAFLREQIQKHCSGTDAELARLRQKYARDPAVMKSLEAYEQRVE